MTVRRLRAAAYWAAPSLFCLVLYWPGLRTWFQADDFAWLSLRLHIYNGHDLLRALFVPMAQGTIRPWSERAFFIVFGSLFGIDALPFHIWIFLTQFASLVLLSSIAWRITGSRLAGFLAPVLWTANSALAVVLSWASAYNQVLCGFFLLAAFWCLLRHIETGRRRFEILEWVLFVLGLGALEIQVVFPALAFVYCLLYAPAYLRRTAPLFAVSAAFIVAHRVAAPEQAAGPYALHFDSSIPGTLWNYWIRTLVPLSSPRQWACGLGWILAAIFTLALFGFTLWMARRRDRRPLFFISWFIITIAPVLPLRDHVSDYYLTIPAIGVAMLGAYAASLALACGPAWRLPAAGLAVAYLWVMIPEARIVSRWYFERGRGIETMVRGVARAHQLHPGKAILLAGVTDHLFWASITHHCFRIVNVRDVYLTPESASQIAPRRGLSPVSDYTLAATPAKRALDQDKVVVYAVGGPRLQNITSIYKYLARDLKPEEPRLVDVADPLMAYLAGPEWYPAEGGFRWMPKHATLGIGGPRAAGEKLHVSGYCARDQCGAGPVHLTVTVDGARLAPAIVREPDRSFEIVLDVPAETIGRDRIKLGLDVDRSFRPPGQDRDLALVFGVFEVR